MIFSIKGVDREKKVWYSIQARSRGGPKGSLREGADRTLKTIQKRETRKKEKSRRGSGTEGGSREEEAGREAEEAAKDSEDSEELNVGAEGFRKGV